MVKHPLTWIEFRVTGMIGQPQTSAIYSTADLGIDAVLMAQNVQRARGGVVEARTVSVTEWQHYQIVNTLGPE